MKSTRYLNLGLTIINLSLVALATQWLGCATPNVERAPEAPGMYDLLGYQRQTAYGSGAMWTAGDADVEGIIGHPFYLAGPTARMVPENVTWSGRVAIVSGTLPPGLELQHNWDITGIPTERGHWIVNFEWTDLQSSAGKSYGGFKQQVRFHITGSGEVNR